MKKIKTSISQNHFVSSSIWGFVKKPNGCRESLKNAVKTGEDLPFVVCKKYVLEIENIKTLMTNVFPKLVPHVTQKFPACYVEKTSLT